MKPSPGEVILTGLRGGGLKGWSCCQAGTFHHAAHDCGHPALELVASPGEVGIYASIINAHRLSMADVKSDCKGAFGGGGILMYLKADRNRCDSEEGR